jgi:hypothetical protein
MNSAIYGSAAVGIHRKDIIMIVWLSQGFPQEYEQQHSGD